MSTCIDYTKRDELLAKSKYILSKVHLQELSCSPPCPNHCAKLPPELQLLEIYTADQYIPLEASISSLLLGLHSLCVTFSYIIKVSNKKISVFFGVSHPTYSQAAIKLIQDTIRTIHPSFSPILIPPCDVHTIIHDDLMSHSTYKSVTSTTLYAPSESFLEPFTAITSTLPSTDYTIICIGEPLDITTHLATQEEYLRHSMEITAYREISHTCTETTNDSLNNASSHAHHKHHTVTCAESVGSSQTHTTTDSCTQNQSSPVKVNDKVSVTLGGNSTHTETHTDNSSANTNNTNNNQSICIQNKSDSNTASTTRTATNTRREINIFIDDLISACSSLNQFYSTTVTPPAFQFSTYFLAPEVSTTVYGASLYMSVFPPPNPIYYPYYLNTWSTNTPTFSYVMDRLSLFEHPVFNCCYKDVMSPALPWSIYSIDNII